MAHDDEEGISLEEILIEMIDAQIAVIGAISGGKSLPDPASLQARLHDLRDLLEQNIIEPDDA